jgi:cell division protease FtsH
MEKRQKFSIWYVLLGIWIVLILQNYITTMFAIKTIPYGEFLKLLKENKVTEVAISANQIQGKINDNAAGKEQMFRTVRVDPDTSKLLEQYNVNFKGEIESRFLATLLSWVVPVFLFFGLWYFLMKRMAGQQPGFMTLGKNKAKIYMQEDIDVRFEDVAGVDESKQELVEVIEFLKEPGKFTEIGGKIPKGILLVGPPGTGKTMFSIQGRWRF